MRLGSGADGPPAAAGPARRGDRFRGAANVGFAILKPQVLDGHAQPAFPILPIWRSLQARGRLHGVAMDAFWMHVGDPAARDAAAARLE